MNNLLLFGLDGGATKVLAQTCIIDNKSSLIKPIGNFIETLYNRSITFNPNFLPVSLIQQQIEASEKNYCITEQEVIQSESINNTIADTISSIKSNDQKYLIGFCFPGLKTRKLDGITIMSNGPRNIEMLSKINDKIKSSQKHKSLIKQIYDDSECCLIGEWKSSIGKLKNCKNAIYVGGGTGIADGVILNNKIIDFINSKILKQSWQLIMPSGQSVENYLSLGGMLNQWNKGKSIEALNSLFENAIKGDIYANQIIENASEAFIFLIKKRIAFFKSHNTSPEKIVIGQRLGKILSDKNNPLSKSIFQNNINATIELSNNRNTAALGAAYKAYDLYK